MNTSASEQRLLFKSVSDLVKRAEPREALRLLQDALRRDLLDAEGRDKAGKQIAKIRKSNDIVATDGLVLLLGQCTTSWLATALTSEAWGRGLSLEVVEGGYDNVLQELMAGPSPVARPKVVVLLPWTQRLLSDAGVRSTKERLDDELAFWKKAWELTLGVMGARILQVGYDWVTAGHLGHHLSGSTEGDVGLIRALNAALRQALPPGSFFVDLEQVSGSIGRNSFYDSRRYFWTKQPFSEEGVCLLARHLGAGVRALLTGPKKALILDLDNTLWGGVVGETGPLGIALGESPDGEAYRAFQQHLKHLSRRGVLLAVCSKNNREDALGPFDQNADMILRVNDFAHIDASWDPKEAGLRRIAESLNLGLDSFVFFDDNPAEREHIRQALPEVEVVEVAADPAEYVRSLQNGLWFETVAISEADTLRSRQYQEEHARRDLQKSLGSMDSYLQSLEMRGAVAPVDDTNMQRVVQLIGKTNQFNLTTRRHSLDEIRQMLGQPGGIGLTIRMVDKFGDHGLIAVLLGTEAPGDMEKALRIDTWLMSCRVIGRTAEQFCYNALLLRARQLGYQSLVGEFIPTAKNAQVADHYERLGFERIAQQPDGSIHFKLALKDASPAKTFVGLEE